MMNIQLPNTSAKALNNFPKSRNLTVNDVLVASWGYEQTNIDYYQVVKLIGKASVSIRPIAKRKTANLDNSMVGTCLPIPDQFIGEALTKRVVFDGLSVQIDSRYRTANKKSYTEENNIRIYKADNWTAYA